MSDGSPRQKVAALLNNRVVIVAELLLVVFILLPYTITPVLLLFGWLSLRLRDVSWSQIGIKLPARMVRTLLIAIPLGALWPLLDIHIVEPWIESLTGTQVDLNQIAGIQDNLTGYLLLLGIVWTLAAFGEEMIFRGYLLNRFIDVLGGSKAALAASLIAVSLCFGFAHVYQGVSGIIETAYVGLGLGLLYVVSGRNLWLPIIVHGVYDTVGITLIYLGQYPGLSAR